MLFLTLLILIDLGGGVEFPSNYSQWRVEYASLESLSKLQTSYNKLIEGVFRFVCDLSLHPFIQQSLHLSLHASINPFVRLSVVLIHLSVHPFTLHPSICPSICSSDYLSIDQSIHLSNHLHVFVH